jgi:hypothetical protein
VRRRISAANVLAPAPSGESAGCAVPNLSVRAVSALAEPAAPAKPSAAALADMIRVLRRMTDSGALKEAGIHAPELVEIWLTRGGNSRDLTWRGAPAGIRGWL